MDHRFLYLLAKFIFESLLFEIYVNLCLPESNNRTTDAIDEELIKANKDGKRPKLGFYRVCEKASGKGSTS